jgi:HK97 family phage prohead protease
MPTETIKQAHIAGQITKASLSGTSPLGPREVRVLASTAKLDFSNEIVLPPGMKPNPADVPVFVNHNSSAPDAFPVGRAKLYATASGVAGTIVFAPEGDDPFADRACKAAKNGTMDAVSIAFTPIKVSRSKDGKILTYESWEINELSLVGIGMNSQARITQRALSAGNPDRQARMARAQAVREKGERLARATEVHTRGLAIQREVSRAEAAAAPSHLDHMSPTQRRQYAREVAARGAPATPPAPVTGREAASQAAARHCATTAAHAMQDYPTKASRQIRAGVLSKPSRDVGRG